MAGLSRRSFLFAPAVLQAEPQDAQVPTVRGNVRTDKLGATLIHEHILVDFVGADKVSRDRYNAEHVVDAALPKLFDLRSRGCQTFVDCTPAWLGRDVKLLAELSKLTPINIVTNTGYYGAAGDKYLPKHAWEETPDQLAARWIAEWRNGIDGTKIRPGFMKLGVDGEKLSGIDRKLIQAGARCHLETGLRMHVHTGPAVAAMDILDELRNAGVHPSAYVWVHAQAEKDHKAHIEAARLGAWIELDGIGPDTIDEHAAAVVNLVEAGFLENILISQDSGWYRVGEPGGGKFNGFTYIWDAFLPTLRVEANFTEAQIEALLVRNPARALTRGVRRS